MFFRWCSWKGASNLELEEDYLKIPTIRERFGDSPSGFSQCLLLLLRNLWAFNSPQSISLFTNYLGRWLVWQKPHRPKLKIVGTHTEKAHDMEDLRTSGRDSFANQDFIEELNSVFKSVFLWLCIWRKEMYTIFIYIYVCTFITFVSPAVRLWFVTCLLTEHDPQIWRHVPNSNFFSVEVQRRASIFLGRYCTCDPLGWQRCHFFTLICSRLSSLAKSDQST